MRCLRNQQNFYTKTHTAVKYGGTSDGKSQQSSRILLPYGDTGFIFLIHPLQTHNLHQLGQKINIIPKDRETKNIIFHP